MARKRTNQRSHWPAHLSDNGQGTFYYHRPGFTPQKVNLGADPVLAIKRAKVLNSRFDAMAAADDADIFQGLQLAAPAADDALHEFTEEWILERGLKASTAKLLRTRSARIGAALGTQPVSVITTQVLSQALEPFSPFEHSKARAHLVNFFRWLRARGDYPAMAPNPASELLTRRLPPKRRARLTLPQFRALYRAAPDWLGDLMLICLHTTLRRDDLVNLRFEQVDGEYLETHVRKSEGRVGGPARLRIWLPPTVHARIDDARERAAHRGDCPFVINHLPRSVTKLAVETKEHHSQVLPHFASQQFKKLRDVCGVTGPAGTTPPTLHEIRALSSHLLAQAGHARGDVQTLMAHTDEEMTAWYQAGHETAPTTVRLPLAVDDL